MRQLEQWNGHSGSETVTELAHGMLSPAVDAHLLGRQQILLLRLVDESSLFLLLKR